MNSDPEFRHTKCSICGENEAIIFVKIVSDEGEEQKGLCAQCAVHYLQNQDQIEELNIVDEKLVGVIEEMKELLSGIVANISAISVFMNNKSKDSQEDEQEDKSLKCPNCGFTHDKFRETGYLGCQYCYDAFSDHIREFVFEMERGSMHKGKMPPKFAKIYILKKEIRFLNNRLKKLLNNEEYEEASKVKKKLERLIGNYDTARDSEIY